MGWSPKSSPHPKGGTLFGRDILWGVLHFGGSGYLSPNVAGPTLIYLPELGFS